MSIPVSGEKQRMPPYLAFPEILVNIAKPCMKPWNQLNPKIITGAGSSLPVLAIIFAMVVSAASTISAIEGSEYEIKGAMIVNFIRFVEWPPETFQYPENTLVIGVLGTDEFQQAFSPIQGRMVAGKRLTVSYLDTLSEIKNCHVLFVGKSQAYRLAKILRIARDLPVLTVGEVREFTRLGGMIRFYRESRHIYFEINKPAVMESKLRISAKLLEIARVVH